MLEASLRVSVIFLFMAIFLLVPCAVGHTEAFRTIVEGTVEVTPERPAESPVSMGVNGAIIINLGAEARFLRGVELEITAPQSWLRYRGALVMMLYNNITPAAANDTTDMVGSRIVFEPLPSRLRINYHIPVRAQHGLRTTTTVSVPAVIAQSATFPIMFRLMEVTKGLPAEFENMRFSVIARPILTDEGAVRLTTRFPPNLRNRPFTVLINDNVITNISEQIMLREGEHHLVVLSDDYRNISRRFIVERARITDLIIELHDPAPVIILEAPQNAQIFLNGNLIRSREPFTTDPGTHEVRFQVGDYTIIRSINVQRGKTYRVAMAVDVTISEEE